MALKNGDLTQQITIRVSENLKAQILYYALLDRKNAAEWVRNLIEEEVEKRKVLWKDNNTGKR